MATILVVDDEPDALNLLRAWLAKHQYAVLTASAGEQAFRLAKKEQPDLILLDVMLPDVDGITICKRLRATPATSRIPVILITAYDPAVGRVEALMAGANDYVTKPLVLHDLLERLRLLLAHDGNYLDQGQRLLEETVHTALTIVPCNLAWLLTLDSQQQVLTSQAVATSESDKATLGFIQQVAPPGGNGTVPLDPADNVLAQVALSGVGVFNLPLSNLRTRVRESVYRACEALDLYFVSVLPVQIVGTPLGAMLIGSRTPRDVETVRGQQIFAAVTGQAALGVQNSYLLQRLSEREAESSREQVFRQTLIDTMSDGLLVYDDRGVIQFANHRLKRMTGMVDTSFLGKPLAELFAENDRYRLTPSLYQPPPQETQSLELNLLRTDGSTIPVLAVQAGASVSSASNRDERVMVITNLSEQRAREQALARQSRRLRALNRATQAITSTLSLDEAIRSILNEASSVFQATSASILLQMPEGERLVYRASVGPNAGQVTGRRVATGGLNARVIEEARPMIEPDLHADGGPVHPIERLTGMTVRSAAAAPLLLEEQVVGVIELLHEQPGVFSRDDLDALEGLAGAAAIAIGNARLYADARRHVRELSLMLEASETASSTLSIEHVVESIARQLMGALSAQWCLVSYWDREEDRLLHLAEVAEIGWGSRGPVVALDRHPEIAAALETGTPSVIVCHDCEPVAALALPPPSSTLYLPIVVEGQPRALASLSHLSDERSFTAEDVDRCQAAVQAHLLSCADRDWTDLDCLRELGSALVGAADAVRCALSLYDPVERRLTGRYEAGKLMSPLGHGPEIPLSDTGLRRVALAEGTPVVIRVGETERLSARSPSFPGVNSGWRLLAPLTARGESIGLVEVIDVDEDRHFTRGDLSLAQAIGGVVGNALENARLYSALLRRAAQLEAAYHDLREMDRHKSEWMQNVSHELRTPLTSIIGYIDLLREGDLGELTADQIEGLDIIGSKSRHLARLVDDILAIQQMEGDPLTIEPASIAAVARSVIETLEPLARRHGLTIRTEFDDDLGEMYINPGYIAQAFENLLRNAIKFSPNGGEIRVKIEDRGVAVRVQVSDDGIGIPEEEQEKIWWRFYQVDGSMTRQYGGTGLGLAIVKQVVEQHDGRIWVESEPGRGSTFVFVLPRLSPEEASGIGRGGASRE